MELETITGNLRDAYQKLQPGTILHVDQLINKLHANGELRNQCFYPADGEIYFLDGAGTPTLAMTREAHNPVLNNIDYAFEQLKKKKNYRLRRADVQQALAAPDTVLIALQKLRLLKYPDSEIGYLALETAPAKYNKLNEEERKFAERVYGQRDDFVQNMRMLEDVDINETRIWVLNPDYVRKHAAEGMIARASWLLSFDHISQFNAGVRSFVNHFRVRGVRKR